MEFKLHSEYAPTGDQPEAIEKLVKPTLIISHNKTLAGQLYSEMKELVVQQRTLQKSLD